MSRRVRTRRQPVCFLGQPRCARRSVNKILEAWDNTWHLHGAYDQFSRMTLSDEQVAKLWAEGWWFTFVRNPWARLVSAWQWFEQHPKLKLAEGNRPRSLADVVRLADIDWPNYLPPATYLPGGDEALQTFLRPFTLTALDKMHFIGQVEAIGKDWETVQDCTGLRVPIGQQNATTHNPYQQYFNAELRDLAARIYREDSERFAYSF